ncbi:MAG: hypothetical protein CL565_01875 [Alphaproteobacteria bacterium]|nr:hypothetical protein [Alphaproteobacteria bacterium]
MVGFIRSFFLISCLSTFLSTAPLAQNSYEPLENPPVILELYTSQNCSSCPPADRYLTELSQSSNIIAISCHVGYWNHLGWVDKLSLPECARRQRGYGRRLEGGRVFTPQMIINGNQSFVGHHKADIGFEIRKQERNEDLYRAEISYDRQNHTLTYRLPELPAGRQGVYELAVFAIKNHVREKIETGENRGRTVLYTNVALSLDYLPNWNGKAFSKTIAYPLPPDTDRLVMLGGLGDSGKIMVFGEENLTK